MTMTLTKERTKRKRKISLTTEMSRRSFMLAVWCQDDEFSIHLEIFRPFIRGPGSSSRQIFQRVSQFAVALAELDFLIDSTNSSQCSLRLQR
ncbi:hypothetical protein HN011_002591 [Eciton burchellii]|nr:hypothetical protein HN011_002591 [Eciton burchellii]